VTESHSLQPALFDFMFKATDGTVFNDKNAFRKYEMLTRYTFHEVLNEQRIKKIGEVDGQPFEVINCRGSELIVLDHTDQVQIDNCVDCKILIGGSSESVFIRSCYNCIFTVACKQLRARDCQSCTFHLCSKTNPVIESSSQIR
jgi:protein XRP2